MNSESLLQLIQQGETMVMPSRTPAEVEEELTMSQNGKYGK
jgi:hypothetical protein